MKLVVKKSSTHSGMFFWVRLVSKNGRTMMVSETYYSMYNADRAAKNLSKKLGVPYQPSK